MVERLRAYPTAAKPEEAADTIEALRLELAEALADVTHWNTTFIEAREIYENQLAAMTAERDELLGTVKRLTVEMRDWQQGDSLRQAKAQVLREAAGRMSIASDYAILFRMADELEQGK